MKEYTSYEIQDISSNFRNVARRLSRTDYSQCDANLKRFMALIQDEELISEYIKRNNTVFYDVPAIIKGRDWLSPFEVSPVQNEEISFAVQLLSYAVENFNGDFTRLYGTHFYTSPESTTNDEMHKFIEHIIDPLIDHIAEYLRHCYDASMRKEQALKPETTPNFTANNSTVVIGSSVRGNISNTVTITDTVRNDASELIAAIRGALISESIPNKEDIESILLGVEEKVNVGEKPHKSLLTALKVLCQTGSVAIPFVTALLELFA